MSRSVWFSILFIFAASLSTFWIFRNGSLPIAPAHKNLPDAFMINASYDEYDAQGLLHSHLVTSRVTHYPHKNSTQVEHPHFTTYADKKRMPWQITADHGHSQNGIERIYLWDHVHLHQPQQKNTLATDITTTQLLILPTQSIAQTDQPVTIAHSDSVVKATGMRAHFKTNRIELMSHPYGVIQSVIK